MRAGETGCSTRTGDDGFAPASAAGCMCDTDEGGGLGGALSTARCSTGESLGALSRHRELAPLASGTAGAASGCRSYLPVLSSSSVRCLRKLERWLTRMALEAAKHTMSAQPAPLTTLNGLDEIGGADHWLATVTRSKQRSSMLMWNAMMMSSAPKSSSSRRPRGYSGSEGTSARASGRQSDASRYARCCDSCCSSRICTSLSSGSTASSSAYLTDAFSMVDAKPIMHPICMSVKASVVMSARISHPSRVIIN
mmetsp:Transcript_29547/g.78607  ORF Transcript_29547/g.78607 Transcript_29547/m.78607 type:complete len:253 (+) Transcript_29547:559-1317(+)